MSTSLNLNKRHAEVEVLKEETIEFPWEIITFVEYIYPYNNEEFIGTLIEVIEPNKEALHYHRIWRESGEDGFNWKHYHRFQRKFIRDIAYRNQWKMSTEDNESSEQIGKIIGKRAE